MQPTQAVDERFAYRRRHHAAVRSESYIFSQLIPYLGNKRKLLPLIAGALSHTGCRYGSFVDLFAGSTVVARMAKTLGFRVVTNDWEPYSFELARGSVVLNKPPPFDALGGPGAVFEKINAAPPVRGYVAEHLCPDDDDNPDLVRERLFFTRENGEKIDAIRELIATWERAGMVSAEERAYLLSPLLYSVSYVSNTSGVFKAFHRGWGGPPGIALYRIRSGIKVNPAVLFDNGKANLAFRLDAQDLALDLRELLGKRPDVVYIDPPYNQHPYGSNYHVLNTVVLWDRPPISAHVTGRGDKSAIRKDWRTDRRSAYNSPATAVAGFRMLLASVEARWLLVSYSTDGNIPLERLLSLLAEKGSLEVFTRKYKRYRVSTPRMSPKPHNVEFVATVDCSRRSSVGRVADIVESIRCDEEKA
jgi:adenine-specific DNA-methyltransferase